ASEDRVDERAKERARGNQPDGRRHRPTLANATGGVNASPAIRRTRWRSVARAETVDQLRDALPRHREFPRERVAVALLAWVGRAEHLPVARGPAASRSR